MLSQREMVIASLIRNPDQVQTRPLSASEICANKHKMLATVGWPELRRDGKA